MPGHGIVLRLGHARDRVAVALSDGHDATATVAVIAAATTPQRRQRAMLPQPMLLHHQNNPKSCEKLQKRFNDKYNRNCMNVMRRRRRRQRSRMTMAPNDIIVVVILRRAAVDRPHRNRPNNKRLRQRMMLRNLRPIVSDQSLWIVPSLCHPNERSAVAHRKRIGIRISQFLMMFELNQIMQKVHA